VFDDIDIEVGFGEDGVGGGRTDAIGDVQEFSGIE
jgi:hypothetical protein